MVFRYDFVAPLRALYHARMSLKMSNVKSSWGPFTKMNYKRHIEV